MIEVDRDSDDGGQSVGSDQDKHLKGKKGFTTPAFSSGARFDFDDKQASSSSSNESDHSPEKKEEKTKVVVLERR
jgi:hypothetical protein